MSVLCNLDTPIVHGDNHPLYKIPYLVSGQDLLAYFESIGVSVSDFFLGLFTPDCSLFLRQHPRAPRPFLPGDGLILMLDMGFFVAGRTRVGDFTIEESKKLDEV